VAPPLPVHEDEQWEPSPDRGECSACGIRAKYVRVMKTWIHEASLACVLDVAVSLELPPSHAVRPLLDD
jgi:hypothetical protein